jgi:ubiquinone/menaquinone biosynthesis C-methylase UbiE
VHKWLQKHGGPDCLCDAHFLPFADQSFNLIYSVAVYEHLACPQLAAQEAYRVLKPGGYFLGNVSFLEPWHDDSFYHMTPFGVMELLLQAGFEIVSIWPGRGYSGYYATASMGSRFTKAFRFFGQGMYFVYRLEHRLKSFLRRNRVQPLADLMNKAKVAGATDWIAKRPV